METTIALQVWETATIYTQPMRYNDGPVRWGYWVMVGRDEIAHEGLQFGKFDSEETAVKHAKHAVRAYQRDKKKRAGR